MKSRFKPTKNALMFSSLFIGAGALYGSTMMFIKPDGSLLHMEGLLPYFSVLPLHSLLYQNYIFPGVALTLINGLPNIASFLLLCMKKYKKGVILGGIQGIVLMLWITIQFVIFPSNILSTSYFVFGLIQALTAYAAFVFLSQENMKVRIEDYKSIGARGKDLVVFFSRLGYTKAIAYEEACIRGADILEIKAKERTEGSIGFWWCGRFGMHFWPMDIETYNIDIEKYDSVIVCSPVWVFGVSSPIRKFLRDNNGRFKRLRLVISHFQPCSMKSVLVEMERAAGVKAESKRSVGSRLGRIREEYRV